MRKNVWKRLPRWKISGAGFALATHDLEIRGAGELLGEEQSGSMETIGFSLYMELLENAVDALKAGREPSLEDLTSQQTEVELRMPSLLPDDFIPDVNTRLSFSGSKRAIASAPKRKIAWLEEIKVELIGGSFWPAASPRCGAYPGLLDVARLRQQAQKLGIRKLEGNEKGGVIAALALPARANTLPGRRITSIISGSLAADWFAAKTTAAFPSGWPNAALKFIQDLSERKTRIDDGCPTPVYASTGKKTRSHNENPGAFLHAPIGAQPFTNSLRG